MHNNDCDQFPQLRPDSWYPLLTIADIPPLADIRQRKDHRDPQQGFSTASLSVGPRSGKARVAWGRCRWTCQLPVLEVHGLHLRKRHVQTARG
jgi:hypothetical protein